MQFSLQALCTSTTWIFLYKTKQFIHILCTMALWKCMSSFAGCLHVSIIGLHIQPFFSFSSCTWFCIRILCIGWDHVLWFHSHCGILHRCRSWLWIWTHQELHHLVWGSYHQALVLTFWKFLFDVINVIFWMWWMSDIHTLLNVMDVRYLHTAKKNCLENRMNLQAYIQWSNITQRGIL